MTRYGQTPFQTVGPYFAIRLSAPGQNVLVKPGTQGAIRIEGRVTEGDRKPVEDALLELWQADRHGRYDHAADSRQTPPIEVGFSGFGRAATDLASGSYRFDTLKPGRVPAPNGTLQAPHVSVVVQARGLLGALFTRVYFDDEDSNRDDWLLSQVPSLRRSTLIAKRVATEPIATYRFDLCLQGEAETVFFDFWQRDGRAR